MRAMITVPQDVRYAWRAMARAPLFTAAAILSLALGIGATTSVFTLMNALMFRALPVRAPGELVELLSRYPGEPRMNGFWWKFYEHYRDRNHVFSDLIGSSPTRFQTGAGGDEETIAGEFVVGRFFPALGIQPAIGRLIEPADDRLDAGDPAVAVVSWSYWESRWQLAPSVVGSRIVLDGVAATVIGVAPREFSSLQPGYAARVWVPAAMEPLVRRPSRRADGQLGLHLVGRLAPGVTIDQAQAEMRLLDRVRVEELGTRDPQWRKTQIEVVSARAGLSVLRDALARPLFALMAIVSLLLLIACTNVAGMLLARATARRREIAIRVALGAGRGRLLQQLLTESLLLSVAGGALGVLVAALGARALARAWPLDPRLAGRVAIPFDLDWRVLLFSAALVIATTVLFGLAPAWQAFGRGSSSLRQGAVNGDSRSRGLFGKSLVAGQVAVSIVLLTAAGLLVNQVLVLRNRDLGFDPRSVLLITLNPARSGYTPEQLATQYEVLVERLRGIPGVTAATLCALSPIQRGAALRFVNVMGFDERPADRRYASLNWVAPDYFEVLRTPIVAGRDFTAQDQHGPRVAIVNQVFARYYFGDTPAIGRRFTFEGRPDTYEIVGVSGDAKYSQLREPPPRTVYLHAFQDARGRFSQFALRTAGSPESAIGEVRRVVSAVLNTVPLATLTTLRDQVDEALLTERLMATLASIFGGIGTFLAAVGMYGLMAFMVARRTSEIAVRMALGATRRNTLRMVIASALRLAAAGLLIGIPLSYWSGRVAGRFMQLTGGTAVPLAVSIAVAVAVVALAAYLPARRAARVEPMRALRQD